VKLYTAQGCSLCGPVRRRLENVRAELPFELEEVDITLDPGLYRQYGERIPVVAVDGVERFEFFVDPTELVRSLDRVGT